jgi:hypothetical protein
MIKQLPSPEKLHELFEFREVADEYSPRNIHVFWKQRLLSYFKNQRMCNWWNANFAGKRAGRIDSYTNGSSPCRKIKINTRSMQEHRIIYAALIGPIPNEIDHKDGVGCNNSLSNLRPATPSQNSCNRKRRADNSLGVSGVSRSYRKWHAHITTNRLHKYLGSFNKLVEACDCIDMQRQIEHGEFAQLNRPQDAFDQSAHLLLEGSNSFEFAQRLKDAGLKIWTTPKIEEIGLPK